MIAADLMYCTPIECCVQPTAYTNMPVRSRPELRQSVSATFRNKCFGIPHVSSTISGV